MIGLYSKMSKVCRFYLKLVWEGRKLSESVHCDVSPVLINYKTTDFFLYTVKIKVNEAYQIAKNAFEEYV
jgi:uncharacterized protein YqkB